MPFTLSHTAFSLLFLKQIRAKKLSATGLILGCMAPDFEYFLRMKMYGSWGHEWWGMLFLDVPIALLIAVLFHQYIRDALIRHAPHALKLHFSVYYQLDWGLYLKQHFSRVVFSILLGIFSHVLWDAFTHQNGFFVENIAVLQHAIQVSNLNIPMYKIAQHMSSLLGLILMMLYVCSLPKSKPLVQLTSSHWYYWLGVVLCFSVFFTLWSCAHPELILEIGHVVVASIACLFWSVLLLSIGDARVKQSMS